MIHITQRREKQPALLSHAAKWTGCNRWAADAAALGFYDDPEYEQLRAVVVLENRSVYGADAHFAMAPGRRMTRQMIAHLSLVVLQSPKGLALRMIWAHIAASNTQAIALAVQCGFEFEYRKRGSAAHGEDAIVLSMKRWPDAAGEPAIPDDEAPQA